MQQVILGHILNPKSDNKADFIYNGALVIEGKVIKELGTADKMLKRYPQADIKDFKGQVIMPPFFDMHFHWVQDDVREMPKDSLLNWLEKYTFPSEAKFASKSYSQKKAKSFFKRLAKAGTLGGACFSSIHEHALDYAMDHVVGDFVIGNVLMTMNSPKNLSQSSSDAIKLVKKLSKKYKHRYCLTPRFAIATDPVTMEKTAKEVRKYNCFKQSHLSETPNEISFVTSLYQEMPGFEDIKTYTDIYNRVGMLGPKSLMGHGIHLKPEELKILSQTKTVIVHCPTSNAETKDYGLGSGLFNFKKAERYKVRWVMGSDIGGGPFLSMFDVMRSFVEQNKKAQVSGATYTKALYRSTLAGAKVMELEQKKGNFAQDKEANFLVLKKFRVLKDDTAESYLARIIKKGVRNRLDYDDYADHVFFQGQKLI
ncbi:MAG: guanine deaminase [Halobacteriovoraceae bacterium]|nr:guanine deaminase [Halobacteriovoraceae bacterium]|tara:strand:- start:19309 stop:20583 length:1275 start_codon:yes stop_codon:yes gene_type:complete